MGEKKRIIVRKERLFFQHYVEVRKENNSEIVSKPLFSLLWTVVSHKA